MVYREAIVGGEEGERWLLKLLVSWARAEFGLIS